MKSLLVLTLVVLLGTVIVSRDDGDWVDPSMLPIDFPVHGFFAGYLNITKDEKAFYYVYTPSESNPSKDPLVALFSPGPGCSVLHSFLYSKGEFVFVRNTVNLRLNHLNWNKQANVLYIEGPAGVGFSYGNDVNITDDSVQQDYFNALLRFYQKFAQLKDQKLYLAGMHYAGITVPRVALNIINHNLNPRTPAWLKINLNGIFLTNPCTFGDECDTHFQFNSYTVKALKDFYFLSKEQYQEFQTHCTLATSECEQIKQKIATFFKLTGTDLRNPFTECLNQPGEQDYGCIDHKGIDAFFANEEVKIDMNADTKTHWQMCNFTLSNLYQRDPDGALKIYETLLREEHNLRIWIVSGALSALVPLHGTKKWFEEIKMQMGRPAIRLWQSWFYKNSINGGEVESIAGMSLITVRSAGFYMFEDQPELANYVFTAFIKEQSI